MASQEMIATKFRALAPFLDERKRRLWAAAEALALGRGGVTAIAAATGLQRNTIRVGVRELQAGTATAPSSDKRVRASGGGRKAVTELDPTLVRDLEALVEPITRGDPMSPLRWTCKSTRQLAVELSRQGHRVSHRKVAELLHGLNYSLQGNRKTREGTSHPDRDSQFAYINAQTEAFQRRGQPVISVDTKKKELIGRYSNKGRRWRPHGNPEKVKIHDFIDPQEPKAIPYGIYDVARNQGWVNVGCDHDTASFAVGSIRRWWSVMGSPAYPQARQLLICADSGGSNGYRVRLWKVELQALVDETGLGVTVCHLPPGTSKWNKVEHRLFSHISMNWRGRPLVSHEVVVNLIGATMSKTGLKVKARLDKRKYPLKVKVTDEQMRSLNIEPQAFHGEWNYTIRPRNKKPN
jgi:transposase-like protein